MEQNKNTVDFTVRVKYRINRYVSRNILKVNAGSPGRRLFDLFYARPVPGTYAPVLVPVCFREIRHFVSQIPGIVFTRCVNNWLIE